MKKISEDPVREERILMEIVVDCYNEHERYSGWYCYLEGRIKFPFRAECICSDPISPLRKGDSVKVAGMLHDDFDYPSDILVKIQWQGRSMGVPLSQLTGLKTDEATTEAIKDWHYWVQRRYRF